MSIYVVDASVAGKWFVEEEHTEAAHSLLDEGNDALAALVGGPVVTADRRLYDGLAGGPYARHVLWIEDLG